MLCRTDPGYWVGKNTLKSWKSIVLRRLQTSTFAEGESKFIILKIIVICCMEIYILSYITLLYPTGSKEDLESKEESDANPLMHKESRLFSPENELRDDSDELVTKPHNSRKRGKVPSNGNSSQTPPEKRLHLPSSGSQNGSSEGSSNMPEHHNGLKNPISPSSSENSNSSSKGLSSNDGRKSKEDQAAHGEDWKEDKKDEENPEESSNNLGFNDDAVCEHGKLATLNVEVICLLCLQPTYITYHGLNLQAI